MANLPESPVYDAGVYQKETSDPVIGGPGGVANAAETNLANRTAYLKVWRDDHEGRIAVNEGAIGDLETLADAVEAALPTHLRHTILTGPISTVTGNENALVLIDGPLRKVGLLDATSGGPITFAFSNGYSTSGIIQSVDYTRRVVAPNVSDGTELVLPVSDGTYFIFAKYDIGTKFISIDYADSAQAYIVSAKQPDPSVVVNTRMIWYNYIESKHYFTTNAGGLWTETVLVPLGLAVVATATATSALTFDYQNTPYDQSTKAGSVDWLAYQETSPLNGGWLLANGSEVFITQYARLHKKIGATYGAAAAGKFKLPDLRGEFLRGLDLGRGITTNALGSVQAEQVGQHTHNLDAIAVQSGAGETVANNVYFTDNGDTGPNAGTENRPRSMAMVPYIKY